MARPFLAEGLEAGQRISYIGSRCPTELAADLAPIGDVDALIRNGQLEVASSAAMYPGQATVDPEAQVATFREINRRARADGYTGYRVVADMTPLLGGPARFAALTRYEHLADRLIAAEQITGMCAFRRDALDEESVELVGCLHPLSAGVAPAFRLYALAPGTLALEGELDVFGLGRLGEALTALPDRGAEIDVDVSGLSFVDHRSLCFMDEWAAGVGVHMRLIGSTPIIGRLGSWLGLRRLRVQEAR